MAPHHASQMRARKLVRESALPFRQVAKRQPPLRCARASVADLYRARYDLLGSQPTPL
jgi:hypothetical protein